MEFNNIKEAAKGYEQAMTKFLRDLVKIPGESAGEKGHIDRIAQEMKAVGFDRVDIDPMGNVLGYMGTGPVLIGFDAHIDTVGIGNRDNWSFDPYDGFESVSYTHLQHNHSPWHSSAPSRNRTPKVSDCI